MVAAPTHGTNPLTVQVNDIFGNPVPGAVVFFIPETNAAGTPSVSPAAAATTNTSPYGQATTDVTSVIGDVIDIQCGNLAPLQVVVSS